MRNRIPAVLLAGALLWPLVGCARDASRPSTAAPTVDSGTDTLGTASPALGTATPPGPTVGSGGDSGSGSGSNGGGTTTAPPPPVAPSPKDCVGYDPANLTVKTAGASGWYMMDGSRSLMLFDTQADAEDGLKVARRYTKHCFIGRSNHRGDRYRYLVDYWEGVSGLPKGYAPNGSCVSSFAPKNLRIVSAGAAGWQLTDPSKDHILLLFDTAADAERGRLVASEHTTLCLIGRYNTRPDKSRYVVEYWL